MGRAFPAVVVGAILAALVGLVAYAINDENRWEEWCASQGGNVLSDTEVNTGFGVGADGKSGVVVVPDTTSFCLTPDGRLIGVY